MGSFSSRCLTLSSFHCSRVESRKKRTDGKPSHTRPCSMAPRGSSSLCCNTSGSRGQGDCPACKAGEGQPQARRGLGTAGVLPLGQATIPRSTTGPASAPQHSRTLPTLNRLQQKSLQPASNVIFPNSAADGAPSSYGRAGTSTSSELEAGLSQ